MKPLFRPASLKALRRHLSKPCLLVFDFDGVLAPVIAARTKAFPSPTTRALIRELARRAPVAVVSGRGLKDVGKRLGFKPIHLLGNHGFEGPKEFGKTRAAAARANRAWVKAFPAVRAQLPHSGLDLEDKKLSLSIHYHLSPEPARTRKALLEWAQTLKPKPRIVTGKNVINLVHMDAAHKGDGMRWLFAKTKFARAVYIGDDVTDEDVFRLRDRRLFTVYVGRKRSFSAGYSIASQKQVDRFLEILLKERPLP
jgi:trehalose 6-phosphate phosphatase